MIGHTGGRNLRLIAPSPTAAAALSTVGAIAAMGVLAAALLARQPRLGLILEEPLVVQVHLYGAAGAFVLGGVLLAWRKGRLFHRVFGWLWVIAVGTATLSFADGVKAEPGDVFEIEAPEFGLPLANPLEIAKPQPVAVRVL